MPFLKLNKPFERKGCLPLHPLRGGGHSSNGTSLDKSFLFLELMVAFTWVQLYGMSPAGGGAGGGENPLTHGSSHTPHQSTSHILLQPKQPVDHIFHFQHALHDPLSIQIQVCISYEGECSVSTGRGSSYS